MSPLFIFEYKHSNHSLRKYIGVVNFVLRLTENRCFDLLPLSIDASDRKKRCYPLETKNVFIALIISLCQMHSLALEQIE